MSKRRAPNKPKVWRAFTQNHPLWNEVINMRNTHATWGNILKYTAEHGYILTQRQIEYGLQQANIDYAHHVVPWIEATAREFIETSLPALEYAQATLQEQAVTITRMEEECTTLAEEYRTATPEARPPAREAWRLAITDRYTMLTQYLTNLIQFRKAMTDLLPADAVRKMVGEEKGLVTTAAGVLAIEDQDVFWREARRLERTVRRDFEIILAAVRRGENVPELRPLGPGDAAIIEGEVVEDVGDEAED